MQETPSAAVKFRPPVNNIYQRAQPRLRVLVVGLVSSQARCKGKQKAKSNSACPIYWRQANNGRICARPRKQT
jgi:hypothetical protein